MLWTKIIDFGRRKDISEYGNATGYWEAVGKHCSFEFFQNSGHHRPSRPVHMTAFQIQEDREVAATNMNQY